MLRVALLIFAMVVMMLASSAQSPISESPCNLTVRAYAQTSSAVLLTHDGQSSIRVCYYSLDLDRFATTTAQLVWGQGTKCATNTKDLSPIFSMGTTTTGANHSLAFGDGGGFIDEDPQRGQYDLCILVSGATPQTHALVRYGLY